MEIDELEKYFAEQMEKSIQGLSVFSTEAAEETTLTEEDFHRAIGLVKRTWVDDFEFRYQFIFKPINPYIHIET